MKIKSHTPEETEKIASELANNAAAGDVYCLTGDLGAGKTVFTKGFAKTFGIEDMITSPTFTLVNEYYSEKKQLYLYHFDVYRLSGDDALYDIGFDDYIGAKNAVCLIEWADIISASIPENATWINISRDDLLEDNDNLRIIEVRNENISS